MRCSIRCRKKRASPKLVSLSQDCIPQLIHSLEAAAFTCVRGVMEAIAYCRPSLVNTSSCMVLLRTPIRLLRWTEHFWNGGKVLADMVGAVAVWITSRLKIVVHCLPIYRLCSGFTHRIDCYAVSVIRGYQQSQSYICMNTAPSYRQTYCHALVVRKCLIHHSG